MTASKKVRKPFCRKINTPCFEVQQLETRVFLSSSVLLHPTADAYVYGSTTSTNYGTSSSMVVKNSAVDGGKRLSYVKFDLTDLGEGTSNQATLRLYGNLAGTGTNNVTVRAYAAEYEAWTEGGITWNARPDPTGTYVGTATVDSVTPAWYEFDVTKIVNDAKANGQTEATIILQGQNYTDRYASFTTRDQSGNGTDPQLVMSVGTLAYADVGSVGAAGSLTGPSTSGAYTISASGTDINNAADSFGFAYQTLIGDGSFVARLTGHTATEMWSRSGLMVRESLAPDSAFSMLEYTTQGIRVLARTTSVVYSTSATADSLNVWMKVERTGNTVQHYVSDDGINWGSSIAGRTVTGERVYVGLARNSHLNTVASSAVFDNVSLGGAWAEPDKTYYVDDESTSSDTNHGLTTGGAFATIQKAMTMVQPGDTVIVKGGTYRLDDNDSTVSLTTSGTRYAPIRIQGADNEVVNILGSYTPQWTSVSSNQWKTVVGRGVFGPTGGQNDARSENREGVWFDGYLLTEVDTVSELNGSLQTTAVPAEYKDIEYGKFWFNDKGTSTTADDEIQIRLKDGSTPNNLSGQTPPAIPNIEVANRDDALFKATGVEFIELHDLNFKYLANIPQAVGAAVQFVNSSNVVIDDITVSNTAATGLSIYRPLATNEDQEDVDKTTYPTNFVVRNSAFDWNGQQGINVNRLQNSTFLNNDTSYNNRRLGKKFSLGFEGGGNKFVRTIDVTIDGHEAFENWGPGIWIDVANERAVVRNSETSGNLIGIDSEISYGTVIYNNLVHHNRAIPSSPSDAYGMGILNYASPGSAIYHNTVYDNDKEGIWVRAAPAEYLEATSSRPAGYYPRGDGMDGPSGGYNVDSYDVKVINNIVSGNARNSAANAIQFRIDRLGASPPNLVPDKHNPDYPIADNTVSNNLFYDTTDNGKFFVSRVIAWNGSSSSQPTYFGDEKMTDSLSTWQSATIFDDNSVMTSTNPIPTPPDPLPNGEDGLPRPTSTFSVTPSTAPSAIVKTDFDGSDRTDSPNKGVLTVGAFDYQPVAKPLTRQTSLFSDRQTIGLTSQESADIIARGGNVTRFDTKAAGEFVTFSVSGLTSSTNYKITVFYMKGKDLGIFKLGVSGSLTGTYDDKIVGIDGYSSATQTDYSKASSSTFVVSTSGTKFFRFAVTGKQEASAGYGMEIDSILIERI